MSLTQQLCLKSGLAFTAILMFLLLTIFFIPTRVLLASINSVLAGEGLTLTAETLGKTFPPGLKGTGWNISSARGRLLTLERASIRLDLLQMLTGKVRLKIDSTIGAGSVKGHFSLLGPPASDLELKGLRLELVPFFATVTGTRVSGIMNGKADISGEWSKAQGYLQLEVSGADFSGIKLGETPLPDASYRTVQGMLRVNGGVTRIESFTLQGEGLYVRIKGNIPLKSPLSDAPLDLTLELMPKPDFLDRQKFIFLLLAKYLDTPGHYQIPIKGVLGKPVMQ